jgi:gliding motility-associated-like protein
MKNILLAIIIMHIVKIANSQCTTSQINFETNMLDWTLIDNNISLPNNVAATVIPPMNIIGVYWWDSTSAGSWISCLNTGLHPTTGIGPNQSMKFRYNYKACGVDTLVISMLVFRDNYCNIYLDGTLVYSDPQVAPTNQINLNVGTTHTFYVPNSGTAPVNHTIDFEIIENNVSYNQNGWGGKLSGTITSQSGDTSIVYNSVGCNNYTCCMSALPLIISGDTLICQGETTALTASGANSYSWTGGISNGVPFAPSTTSTYSVTGTDTNGCNYSSSILVNVLTAPLVTATASPMQMCNGSSTTLMATGTLSYSWSGGVSNGVAFIPSASATYTVTGTDANGCSNTASVFITVLPPPAVTAIASPASVCQNSPTTLSGAGALSYTWSGGVTNGVPFTPTSTSTYTVTGTDANGCTQTSTVTVNVVTDVLINIIPNNPILCLGDSIQLTASGAINYNWIPNSNISATTGSNPFVFPAATSTYTVTGTDATGCTGTSTVTIDIINDPKLTLTKSGDVECNTNTIQLAASGAASYSWSPASLLSAPNGAVTNATVFEPTTFVVTGVVGSCIVTDSIRVNVYNNDEAAIFIPNAFTPNGDGNNDCLRVLNKANFSKYYFTVYNRWGQRVFEADNPSDCWDGTFNSQQVQLGTYYFFLQGETRCGKVFKKGDITVIY